MSALSQGADSGAFLHIDREHFKDVIGNLNWNKFSERIQNQLQTNQNLTAEQRKAMEVNLIVALIRSNQLEQAKKELDKQRKAKHSHPALAGIATYLSLK